MVNTSKGYMIESDPQMIQFLMHLDERQVIKGKPFVIQQLDERRLFVTRDCIDVLEREMLQLMDKLAVNIGIEDESR